MNKIPEGDWSIEAVIVNEETVMNNDGMRAIEIGAKEWVIQPAGQRFQVKQIASNSAVLESGGETYYADFQATDDSFQMQLSRRNIKETVRIEAVAINADVLSFGSV